MKSEACYLLSAQRVFFVVVLLFLFFFFFAVSVVAITFLDSESWVHVPVFLVAGSLPLVEWHSFSKL